MIESLLLVLNASLSALSVNPNSIRSSNVGERTATLIASEIAARAHSTKAERSSELMALMDNYFMDANGNWTDSSYTWYWDDDWIHYNCYAYAIPRHDLTPEYYPPFYELSEFKTKWYIPGQFVQNCDYDHIATAEDIAERVCEDFEVLGFTNISCFRLPSVLPTLGTNEELIAVRVSAPGLNPDSHFMHYCKNDGYWYHKMDVNSILKYKYHLSESRLWYHEAVSCDGAFTDVNYYYSGEIWLVKYTPVTVTPTFANASHGLAYCENYADTVVAVDVDSPGRLEVSFTNINGFTAILYSPSWDAIDSVTYQPIEASVTPGRYYIVMRSYRYRDYIGVHASLSPFGRGAAEEHREDLIVVSENDRLVQARVSGDNAEVSAISGDWGENVIEYGEGVL